MDKAIVPVLTMIDTLHLGLYLKAYRLTDEEFKRLDDAKRLSRDSGLEAAGHRIEFKGKYFNITSARKIYAYVLYNDDLTVKIAKMISDGAYPEIFIEFRSRFLMSGLSNAYQIVKEWVSTWAEISTEKVSRADIAQDYQGIIDLNVDNIVMRCRNSSEHYDQFVIHRSGRKLTGYSFGSGELMLRIYDKTEEIKKSCKEYIKAEWKNQGWDGVTAVWRIEAQLRRKVLKEFKIETVEDLISKSADIWKYVTGQWFTVRTPSDLDKTRSRWKLSAQWEVVHLSFRKLGSLTGAIRERIKEATIDKMIPQIAGLMTSVSALMKKEQIPLDEIFSMVRNHYGKSKRKITEVIDDKKRRYCHFDEAFIDCHSGA